MGNTRKLIGRGLCPKDMREKSYQLHIFVCRKISDYAPKSKKLFPRSLNSLQNENRCDITFIMTRTGNMAQITGVHFRKYIWKVSKFRRKSTAIFAGIPVCFDTQGGLILLYLSTALIGLEKGRAGGGCFNFVQAEILPGISTV